MDVMSALEPNEVIVLVLLLIGYVPLVASVRRREFTRWFFFAYTALLIGGIATVVEGFWYPDQFNLVEHLVGVALAGVLFLLGAYMHFLKLQALGKPVVQEAAVPEHQREEHLAQLNKAMKGGK
jgi:hypothetical protein